MLLSGNNRPVVSLTRDRIKDLPFEATFDIVSIVTTQLSSKAISPMSFFQAPASLFYNAIEKYEPFKKTLQIEPLSIHSWPLKREYWFEPYHAHDLICAANAKRHGLVYSVDEGFKKAENIIIADPSGFFPVLFFADEFNSDILGYLGKYPANCYSPSHQFSRWLIKNRELLQRDAPSVYSSIIASMVESNNPAELVRTLNKILDRLRSLPNDPFWIPHDLRIKEGDITFFENRNR